MHVTPIYIAALSAMLIGLGARTMLQHRRLGSVLGGRVTAGLRPVRTQSGFLECVALTLLLVAMMELDGAPSAWLHGLGGVLVVGSLVHARGSSRPPRARRYRALGMLIALASIALAASYLLATLVERQLLR